ncbi:MAG: hypothetical protein PUE85_04815 [Firmicutes bacterium]|nr:hypothetical protein [Bacillota bacterium]
MNLSIGDNKNRKKRDEKTEELLVNRLMLLFVAAIVAVVALLAIKKNGMFAMASFIMNVLPWAILISGLLLAGAAALFIYRRVKHIDDSMKVFSSGVLLFVAAMLFLLFSTYEFVNRTSDGFSVTIAAIIIVTALCFIFSFYSRDFFRYSLFTAVGAALLYYSRGSVDFASGASRAVVTVLAALLAAAVIVFMLVLRSNGGKISLGGKTITVMARNHKYYPFFIGAGSLLCALAFSAICSSLSIYALFAFAAVYLIIAIIYTVRMI